MSATASARPFTVPAVAAELAAAAPAGELFDACWQHAHTISSAAPAGLPCGIVQFAGQTQLTSREDARWAKVPARARAHYAVVFAVDGSWWVLDTTWGQFDAACPQLCEPLDVYRRRWERGYAVSGPVPHPAISN